MSRHKHSEAGHLGGGRDLRDLVFGANDGLVAAFAVVSGVHGAAASTRIVLLAGLAELIGGTISMGLGAWLAAKSEREFIASERAREEREVIESPEEERQEVREIYAAKGLSGETLEAVVAALTKDPKRWVDLMMDEELGLSPVEHRSPLRSAVATGLSYTVGAAFPVLPYLLPVSNQAAFAASISFTLGALFFAGALKTRVTDRPFFRSGIESMGIGALAAGATYLAGRWIAG
jgi:VIT1/CCC1 family predicted Fe2+/Mn2+ transporter